LATSEERAEHIGVAAGNSHLWPGCADFGGIRARDGAVAADSSGADGCSLHCPIITAIILLLCIVFFSYRQTIAAYPAVAASYTVATENLGTGAGLLAAAALMIDYILTAAVGVSAGIEPWSATSSGFYPIR